MQASHAATTLDPAGFRSTLRSEILLRCGALVVLLVMCRIGPSGLPAWEMSIAWWSSSGTNDRRLMIEPTLIIVWNGKMNWLIRCQVRPSPHSRWLE